jgi:hypothetical protein
VDDDQKKSKRKLKSKHQSKNMMEVPWKKHFKNKCSYFALRPSLSRTKVSNAVPRLQAI